MTPRKSGPYQLHVSPPLRIKKNAFQLAKTETGMRQHLVTCLQEWIQLYAVELTYGRFHGVDPVLIECKPMGQVAAQLNAGSGRLWEEGLADEARGEYEYPGVAAYLESEIRKVAWNHQRTDWRRQKHVRVSQDAVDAARDLASHDIEEIANRNLMNLLDDADLTLAWQKLPHTQRIAFGLLHHGRIGETKMTPEVLESITGISAKQWRTWKNAAEHAMYDFLRRGME